MTGVVDLNVENGWNEYKRLILSALEDEKRERCEIRDALTGLRDHISGLRTDVATLQSQLSLARWLITPLVAAVSGGAVAWFMRRLS